MVLKFDRGGFFKGGMRAEMKCFRKIICLCILLLMFGCSTKRSEQARRGVAESGFLGDYSILRQGGEGEPLLIYRNPEADWPSYKQILLDPVAYYGGPETYPKGATRNDLQDLVNRFYYILYNVLAEDYQMVDKPGPYTLRLQLAITSVKESSAAMDTVSVVAPYIINPARNLAGNLSGESPFTGEASIEAKITDGSSGELLYAAVDRRVGERTVNPSTRRWVDVEQILYYWGDLSRYRLCKLRGGEDCSRPEQ